MSRALETRALAVVMLAFLAVGREGGDRAVHGGLRRSRNRLAAGRSVCRVAVAVGIAWGMYAGAVRINLAKFFKYTGVFLIVVAAGILAYGIGALQTVGWLPMAGLHAFDISSWFNWSAWYGEIVQGVFNITPTPTVLQLLCWLAYLVVVLTVFLRPVKPAAPQPRSVQPPVPVAERSAL